MPTRRPVLFQLGASAIALAFRRQAGAQSEWPERPVRVVSPYAPGGPNDLSARVIGEELGRRLGQPFLVENKPGAGSRLANEAVARATPDGYTLLYAGAPFATAESLYGKLGYDTRQGFAAIGSTLVAPLFLVVPTASSANNAAGLVALGKAKAKAEGLTLACAGSGSVPHLVAELFFAEAGVRGLNVHFRGELPALTELIAGRVDAMLCTRATALPHVQAGKLRVLGVASEQRESLYAEAPTLREQGFAKAVGFGWCGYLAPASTSALVVQRMNSSLQPVLAEPVVRQRLTPLGLEARSGSPAAFAKFVNDEMARWAAVVRAGGIQGD